ncbi:MAG: tetratricopeptide repeat protein [Phormidesmis sp.]
MADPSVLQLAINHHQSKEFVQAEKIYRQILKVQPDSVEVLYRLGVLKQQEGKPAIAQRIFEDLLRLEPDSFQAWFSLGNLHQSQAQWSKAVSAYQQALAIRPDDVAIINNLGYALQQQGLVEDAIAYYQKALALQPDCTEAKVNLASSLLTSGSIYSFDVFDTLITRFCITPDAIFRQVERKMGFDNFANYRQAIEQSLLQQADDYTLKDIYQQLAQALNLNRRDAEALKAAEIEAEFENVVGIKENLEKVNDGDLLVSDMYLPKAVLRKMLQKAGLDKKVELFVSAQGKQRGTAWQKIINHWQIAQHLGDNPHSDVHMAQQYGIRAQLYSAAQPSAVEAALCEIGAGKLAKIIRKIRLEHPFKAPLRNDFYNCFVQGNLVMLTIFSVFLLKTAEEKNIRRFLLSSRDCYHLNTVFRQIIKCCHLTIDCQYFLTSRLSRISCSEDYLSYVLQLIQPGSSAAIVDLAGTGLSLSYLLQQVREEIVLPPVPLVFFHHIHLDRVETMYRGVTLDKREIHSLILEDAINLDLDALEILNYIKQPMLKDMCKQGAHQYSPIYFKESAPAEILTLIDATEEIVDDFSSQITSDLIDELRYDVDWEDLCQLSLVIYQQLSRNDKLLSYFMSFHAEENREVEQALSAMLAEHGLS